jgi:F-type H+-transporting ATPase subunit b
MTYLTLVLAQNGGGQVTEIARTFGVDWPHLIAQIISFCIVCFLLYKFAYKPILAMLTERRQQIEQGLADTKKIKAELERIEAQRQEILFQANAHATKLIEEAHAAAAQVQKQETQNAILAAEQIVLRAHETASQDYDRMLVNLKNQVGRLAVQATAKITGRILTPEDQQRLADETTRRIAA